MPAPLVRDPASIRLALAGMVPDDNRPYSSTPTISRSPAVSML